MNVIVETNPGNIRFMKNIKVAADLETQQNEDTLSTPQPTRPLSVSETMCSTRGRWIMSGTSRRIIGMFIASVQPFVALFFIY